MKKKFLSTVAICSIFASALAPSYTVALDGKPDVDSIIDTATADFNTGEQDDTLGSGNSDNESYSDTSENINEESKSIIGSTVSEQMSNSPLDVSNEMDLNNGLSADKVSSTATAIAAKAGTKKCKACHRTEPREKKSCRKTEKNTRNAGNAQRKRCGYRCRRAVKGTSKAAIIAAALYGGYNVYNKNTRGGNFGFATEHAKNEAARLRGNVACAEENAWCGVKKGTMSTLGAIKGFFDAEACILSDYKLCSDSTQNSLKGYKSDLLNKIKNAQ